MHQDLQGQTICIDESPGAGSGAICANYIDGLFRDLFNQAGAVMDCNDDADNDPSDAAADPDKDSWSNWHELVIFGTEIFDAG